jgi:hypothetical protein
MQTEVKVFICYAREDREIAQHLYADLQQAGIAPWMACEDILPGQDWELGIDQAIRASSYFVALLSSHSVSRKGFVQKELKKALEVLDELPPSQIFIIPARLEECQPVDERLRKLHWVDLFPSYEAGLQRILRVLVPDSGDKQTSIQPAPAEIWEWGTVQRRQELEANYDLLSEKISRLRKAWIIETDAAQKFRLENQIKEAESERTTIEMELRKLFQADKVSPGPMDIQPQGPQPEPEQQKKIKRRPEEKPPQKTDKLRETSETQKAKQTPVIRLRSEPLTVSDEEAEKVFKIDGRGRPLEYIQNDFEDRGEVIVDHTTGLIWQKSGSDSTWTYQQAQVYIKNLNRDRFAGHDDWRLPTIPELMSLLEPKRQPNALYINPTFDSRQQWCWSTDLQDSAASAWHVDFSRGVVYGRGLNVGTYVRAVRS